MLCVSSDSSRIKVTEYWGFFTHLVLITSVYSESGRSSVTWESWDKFTTDSSPAVDIIYWMFYSAGRVFSRTSYFINDPYYLT